MKSESRYRIVVIGLLGGVLAVQIAILIVWHTISLTKYRSNTEFWISTNAASRNLGTYNNPFICTNEPEFDYVMSNLPPDCTVHILAGTYQTLGGGIRPAYSLKSGQRILGSGMDSTIIQLVPHAPSGNCVMGSVGRAVGIEVSDLTLDCHYIKGQSGNVTYGGLDLNGTMLTAKRVKVINLVYLDKTVNSEVWGIGFNSTYTGPFNSEHNIIEGCVVSNFIAGTGCSAIALNGGCISGIICNNKVFLRITNAPIIAFNGGNMHDVVIQNNYVEAATAAFYGDAAGYSNIVVAHNTFTNCIHAVQLKGFPRQNLVFCYNTITIPSCGGQAFEFSPDTYYTNIVIVGNKVAVDPHGINSSLFLNANNIRGLVLMDNTCKPALKSTFSNCAGSGMDVHNGQRLE